MTVVTMHCAHDARFDPEFAPRTGESIYCYACDDMRRVVLVTGMWIVTCESGDFHRVYQIDGRAASGIRKHLSAQPAHVIAVAQVGTDQTYRVRNPQDRML